MGWAIDSPPGGPKRKQALQGVKGYDGFASATPARSRTASRSAPPVVLRAGDGCLGAQRPGSWFAVACRKKHHVGPHSGTQG